MEKNAKILWEAQKQALGETAPKTLRAVSLLAQALQQQGFHEQALTLCDSIFGLEGLNKAGRRALAEIYEANGQIEKADALRD